MDTEDGTNDAFSPSHVAADTTTELKNTYMMFLETGIDIATARLEIWRIAYDQASRLCERSYGKGIIDGRTLIIARGFYSKVVGERKWK
jgi:limonene-1,2-epoxide hydrolase